MTRYNYLRWQGPRNLTMKIRDRKANFVLDANVSLKMFRSNLIVNVFLRTVPSVAIAHTLCASRDTRVSYGSCLLQQGYLCEV